MKIPEKVKIGGLTYTVIFTAQPNESDSDVDGIVVYEKQEIRLKAGFAKEYTEKVFLHEVIHAIINHFQISFKGQDEFVTETMAHGIYMIYKDNPNMFKEDTK
jgi:predicted metal-dependent peptidase